MTITYLDTSAAMKLLVEEPESDALVTFVTRTDSDLVASWLLHAELHCAASRHPTLVTAEAVASVLNAITLVDLTRGDILSAGTHPPLRSHDALHLATALRIGSDAMLTYDGELQQAASSAGLRIEAPNTRAESRNS